MRSLKVDSQPAWNLPIVVDEVQNHAALSNQLRRVFDAELYTFVRSTLPAEGYDGRWRVALVTSADDHSHDFLETVSQNAGYQVMVFKSYQTAQEWLCRT